MPVFAVQALNNGSPFSWRRALKMLMTPPASAAEANSSGNTKAALNRISRPISNRQVARANPPCRRPSPRRHRELGDLRKLQRAAGNLGEARRSHLHHDDAQF